MSIGQLPASGNASDPGNTPPVVVKPGYQTSELYVALSAALPAVIAVVAVLLHWAPEQAQAWQGQIAQAAALVGSLAVMVLPLWKYIHSRAATKAAAAQAAAMLATQPQPNAARGLWSVRL